MVYYLNTKKKGLFIMIKKLKYAVFLTLVALLTFVYAGNVSAGHPGEEKKTSILLVAFSFTPSAVPIP